MGPGRRVAKGGGWQAVRLVWTLLCSGETAFVITENLLSTPRTLLLAALLAAAVMAPRAHAADAPAGAADRGGTLAERAKLQAQLDRVNAEIDALKRRPLGIRDDYRLRSRMADAEALARRLNEIDARLGPVARPAPSVAPPEIHVSPSDDRAEREAKADILADQAHRLSNEANVLEGRLTTLRARNELKRRSGQLERDPFAPLEQVKSRVGVMGNGTEHGTFLPPATDSNTKGAPPPRGTTGTPTSSGAGDGSNGAAPGMVSQPTTSPGGGVLTLTPSPTPVLPSTDATGGSLAGQLRGVLDPSSLEEVRRLETPGAAPANLQVMERALATLRGRAAQLSAASAALRAPRPPAP